MKERIRTAAIPRGEAVVISDDARRVLRNTWNLLALTLLFSAGMGLVAMTQNWPYVGPWIFLGGVIGLLLLTRALQNSGWGILAVFALTGFMGATMGSIVNFYLAAFANGHQLVIAALGTTGIAFFGLSGFALVTRRDFSFLGPMLFVGFLVAFVAMLAALIFNLSALSLAVAAMFALLSCGLIVFQTQQIVRGGERNYISATVALYVSIYNIFITLLQLFGFAFGDD